MGSGDTDGGTQHNEPVALATGISGQTIERERGFRIRCATRSLPCLPIAQADHRGGQRTAAVVVRGAGNSAGIGRYLRVERQGCEQRDQDDGLLAYLQQRGMHPCAVVSGTHSTAW